ncbi:veratrol--corrinoid protein metyltransferase [Alkalibaculum sp. M08DMB]|uniref:Veratrol--corrinoid protein metyltransferase n=1 Tax=Alkalibaculum sporogenes TaxID=2655001 RepID=A0A6A7KAG8_9FIRM|nr:uroporphyrinogen decarboxylase family protein [Alkalibaculum sporogenes]MPW26500.1 veratrol--corrinoid protein metyltransferase [Alkalibaculum sporogenes]
MIKSKLTPKENYMRIVRGEMPEWVPIHTMGMPGYKGDTAYKMCGPFLWPNPHIPTPEPRYDIWGVKYVTNEETGYAAIPEPNNFLLEDVTKWYKAIKNPEMPDVDWEQQAKKDFAFAELDRSTTAAMAPIELMPFQQLIAFMGFTNGLCAMYEEPESVKELLNYLADFIVPIVEKTVEYYQPDMVYVLDDTAAQMNPFVSVEMYRDILKPIYVRLTKPAIERGIPVQFHNCGRCEDFIDDMLDFGVRMWDPAQTTNDLLGIKEKYKGKLAIAGGYDWVVPITWPEVDEEMIRQTVRDSIDKFAPGGGFAISPFALGPVDDPIISKVNEWLLNEAYYYGRDYYL